MALANIGTPEAVRSRADFAVTGGNWNRELFGSALADVTSARGQEALIGIVADATLPDDVRAAAAISLGRHGGPRIAAVLENIAAPQDGILALAVATAIEARPSSDKTTVDSVEESCFSY